MRRNNLSYEAREILGLLESGAELTSKQIGEKLDMAPQAIGQTIKHNLLHNFVGYEMDGEIRRYRIKEVKL